MRILVVTPHYYPESFSITSICEGFVREGHDVLVVTDQPNYGFERIKEGYEHVFDETINGVAVHRIKTYPRKRNRSSIIKNYLGFWSNSKRFLRKLKGDFDVVYSMSLSPVIAVSGANKFAKKHKIKHILHCLDLWPESTVITGAIKKGSLAYKILYKWSRGIYSKADEVLISSPSFESYFRNELKLKDLKISYVPQPALIAKQVGDDRIYERKFNFVYAGNIGTLQLIENIVKAFAFVKENAHLHLIGMGSRKYAVLRLVDELGLQKKVSFYGPKSRGITSSFYKNCTGIIVSLKNEGVVGSTIPSKLVTSMTFGKPFVACIGGDGKAVLEDAGGTVFSKGESPEELAEAFNALCDLSEDERMRMGKANLDYYSEHFDFDKLLKEIVSHLKQ